MPVMRYSQRTHGSDCENRMSVTERLMRRFESSGRARYACAHDAFHSVQFDGSEPVINLTSHVLRRCALSIGGKRSILRGETAKTGIRPTS